MAMPNITLFTGILPSEDDPATFPARAEGALSWMVQHQMPQTKQAVEWMGAALAGAETIVDAVGGCRGDLDGLRSSLVGMVAPFAMADPPDGWLECNGALISRITYAALFALIGTTYGAGDGSTTFALPDFRGEFLRGWDNGRGVDVGRLIGSGQAHELASHRHGYVANAENNDTTGGYQATSTDTAGSRWLRTNVTNYFGGSETRPRNIAQMFCIKY